MKKLGKYFVVLLVIMLLQLAMTPAFAASKGVIKLAHSERANDLFEDHYKAMGIVFKTAVENGTNGRFTVKIYPNGQLGDLRSMLEQCQKGLIQMTTGQSIGNNGAYYPLFNLFETPYLFRNHLSITETFRSPLVQKMVEECAKTKGIRVLGIMPAGMRNFSNNVKPIKSPADMKGMKMRVMEIPIYIKMIEALGASATPVSWSELYTACQTGVVDGQENAPNTMLLAGIQEVQKYYTLDNHTGNTVTFNINEKFYQSLSDSDKKTIQRATRLAIESFMGLVNAKEVRDLEFLGTKMEITRLTEEERNEFKKVVLPKVLEYLKKELGEENVEQFVKQVEEVEKKLF